MNGATAGTVEQGRRLEAVKIVLAYMKVEAKAPVDGVARRIPTRLVTHPDSVLVGMAAIAVAPMNYALDYAGRGWG